jgi:hypothetical protein
MLSALGWMLVQPADDADDSAVVLGAWPCAWDVDFKLRAPRNTTVEGTLRAGNLTRLVVTPPSRAAAMVVRPCQNVSK